MRIDRDEDHVYRVDGRVVPSVTQILRHADDAADWSAVRPEVLAHAGRRGHYVHQITRYASEGRLDPESVDPRLAAYLVSWNRLLRDTRLEPVEWEVRVYHPDEGDGVEYAGTCDGYGCRGDDGVLFDIKTGGPQSTDTAQLAAYVEAWRRTRPADPVDLGWILRLRPNGPTVQQVSPADLRLAYRYTFVPALRRWWDENSKGDDDGSGTRSSDGS